MLPLSTSKLSLIFQYLLDRPLQINGKDVYIPLHEDSLQRIDHKKCIVQVELPEGLLDIYLS